MWRRVSPMAADTDALRLALDAKAIASWTNDDGRVHEIYESDFLAIVKTYTAAKVREAVAAEQSAAYERHISAYPEGA